MGAVKDAGKSRVRVSFKIKQSTRKKIEAYAKRIGKKSGHVVDLLSDSLLQ